MELFDKQCLLFFKANSLVRVLKPTLTHIMIHVNHIKTIVNLPQLLTIIENIRKSKSTLMFLAICHKLQVLEKK